MQDPLLNPSEKMVNDNLTPTDDTGEIINLLTNNLPIVGSGSPEGVVEAFQFSFYIDRDGISGTILYLKKLPNIGGDPAQGWVAV